jgi:hypothetical protein
MIQCGAFAAIAPLKIVQCIMMNLFVFRWWIDPQLMEITYPFLVFWWNGISKHLDYDKDVYQYQDNLFGFPFQCEARRDLI